MQESAVPNRIQRITQKFLEEKKHMEYLLQKGMEPFEIADQMIHYQLVLIREQINNEHPEWTENQIILDMRNQIKKNNNMKRRREFNG